jgi:hypothetical protein
MPEYVFGVSGKKNFSSKHEMDGYASDEFEF